MYNTPVALVTGANTGIGLQVAKDLACLGFTVVVGSRDLDRGLIVAAEIRGDEIADEAAQDRSPALNRLHLLSHP